MAEFRVVLTVKDRYGNIKEVDGGTINVDLTDPVEIDKIQEALPFNDYLKKSETDYLATDVEVAHATKNTVRYDEFKLAPENTEEAGK